MRAPSTTISTMGRILCRIPHVVKIVGSVFVRKQVYVDVSNIICVVDATLSTESFNLTRSIVAVAPFDHPSGNMFVGSALCGVTQTQTGIT